MTDKHTPDIDSDYLGRFFDPQGTRMKKHIIAACLALKDLDFDAIAFRGISGALTAPILAYKLHKTLIAVRKPTEDNHSGMLVEGDKGARRYIVVDEIVASGNTVCTIVEKVRQFAPEAQFIGCWVMNYDEFLPPWDYRFTLAKSLKVESKVPSPSEEMIMTYYSTRMIDVLKTNL